MSWKVGTYRAFRSALQFFYYPLDMVSMVMEMLREEKPIWVSVAGEESLYIGTHEEPVGEGQEG